MKKSIFLVIGFLVGCFLCGLGMDTGINTFDVVGVGLVVMCAGIALSDCYDK